jgi:hypothetical protein
MPVNGTWWNELGSQMTISTSGSSVYGTYNTAVGSATGNLGWTVAWTNPYGNAHSATSWAGQYQVDNEGELIYSLWLLASEVPPSMDWSSTQVGQDTFRRTQPTAEAMAVARVKGASHPAAGKFEKPTHK